MRKGGLRKRRPNQRREFDYATIPTPAIFELLDEDIFSMAEKQHAVFLWTIDDFLMESETYMKQRGYKRHCRFIWDMGNGVAPGFTIRYSHEYLICYYKEKMLPIDSECGGKYWSVFTEKARQHSRKPEVAYEMISSFFPHLNKMDVFSRQKRSDWDQFGDHVDFFVMLN